MIYHLITYIWSMGDFLFMRIYRDKARAEIASEIGELESALSDSYNALELVSEDGLVDFYAYLIKAYEAKHQFLLKMLKEN